MKKLLISLLIMLFPACLQAKDFSTTGHPKSRGLNMNLEYPNSWGFQEGKRPNTLGVFKEENQESTKEKEWSYANCALTIKSATQLTSLYGHKLTKDDWKDILESFNEEDMASIAFAELDGQGSLVQYKQTNFDRYPGIIIETKGNLERAGTKLSMHGNMYVIGVEEYMVFLICASSAFSQSLADERFEKKDKVTFGLIANSIIFPDQYK